MSRPARILNALSPLMRMTSIEAALAHNVDTHQRREAQRRQPSGQPRREALPIR